MEIAGLPEQRGEVSLAAFSPDGSRILTVETDKVRIWDSCVMTMSPQALVAEVCMRRLCGRTELSRDEMRLAGYPDDMPEIDVRAGIE